jgi:hypothetical protein
MAVERVASPSVPDVTQTDSTDTTMPVALARRAEDDTRTQVRENRAHCDALQPAHLTAHKSLHHISAVCYRLQHRTRPGLCLTHPGWRPAGQPAQRVSLQGKSTTNVGNTRRRRQPCRISANRTPKPRQDSCNLQYPPRIWKVINTTKEKPALLAHRTGTAARKARQPNRFRFFPLPSLPYWLKPHFYQTLFYLSPLWRINSFGTHAP